MTNKLVQSVTLTYKIS